MSKEDNPWRTLSTRVAYRNHWITVREDQVIRPDGTPGIYGVVEARRAIGVVALTVDREIYLIGQYRYAMEQYSWEIIEGGAEKGEQAQAAAARELQEEAGLAASEWSSLGAEIHLSNCHSSEVAQLFVARGLREVPSSPEGTEVLACRRLPLSVALEMVYSGEIKDALTIIALYRIAHE